MLNWPKFTALLEKHGANTRRIIFNYEPCIHPHGIMIIITIRSAMHLTSPVWSSISPCWINVTLSNTLAKKDTYLHNDATTRADGRCWLCDFVKLTFNSEHYLFTSKRKISSYLYMLAFCCLPIKFVSCCQSI